MTDIDLAIENHGSIYLVRPMSKAGREWIKSTSPDDAQFMGDAMAVEPRYVAGVVQAASDAGLNVDGDD